MPTTKVINLSPKMSMLTLEQELQFGQDFQDQTAQLIAGMHAGSRELSHGKIRIQGLDERMLFGDAVEYDEGIGVYIGKDPTDGLYKFRAGDPDGVYIGWDGAALSVFGFLEEGEAANDVNTNVTTIDGGKITALSVTAAQIAANTITSGKITTGEFITLTAQIKDAIISNAKIISITADKISTSILDAQIASIAWAKITSVSVQTADIANAAITNAKINDLSATKITAGDIASARMQTNVLTALQVNVSVLSAITANLGSVLVGGSADALGTVVVRNSSGTEITKLNNSGVIVRNTRGLFFEQTTGGNYWDLSVNSSNQAVMSLPTTNQFFMKNFAGDTNLFTVSNSAVFSLRRHSFGDGVEFENSRQYIDDDNDNDLRLHFRENAEFYKDGTLKAIIDSNIFTEGDLLANGSKPFLIPHPDGSDRMLRYTAQESPDVVLRYRGMVEIEGNGEVEIIPPEHFILITEPNGLVTVNLTSMSANHVWVKSIRKNNKVVVAGSAGSKAMFEIIAIRKGYLDQAVELDRNDPGLDEETKGLLDRMEDRKSKRKLPKPDKAEEKVMEQRRQEKVKIMEISQSEIDEMPKAVLKRERAAEALDIEGLIA